MLVLENPPGAMKDKVTLYISKASQHLDENEENKTSSITRDSGGFRTETMADLLAELDDDVTLSAETMFFNFRVSVGKIIETRPGPIGKIKVNVMLLELDNVELNTAKVSESCKKKECGGKLSFKLGSLQFVKSIKGTSGFV